MEPHLEDVHRGIRFAASGHEPPPERHAVEGVRDLVVAVHEEGHVARSRRHRGAEALRVRRLLRLEVELRRGEERVRSEPVEFVDNEGEFRGEGGEEFR